MTGIERNDERRLGNAPAVAELDPLQIAAWRRLTFDQKWGLVRKLNALVRQSVRNRLRRRHPELTTEALDREVSRFLTRSRT